MSRMTVVTRLLLAILFTHVSVGQPQCDRVSQSTITSCAHELAQLGIFSNSAVRLSTFDELRQESKDYFERICSAYERFNTCLGGGEAVRSGCWAVEPIKGQYAVADAALQYICDEGYFAMLSNWDCYLRSASRSDVALCEAQVAVDSNAGRQFAVQTSAFNARTASSPACYAMQNYVRCIREPISVTCGQDAWHNVVQAIERPMQVYLPFCTLTGSPSSRPSATVYLTMFTIICSLVLRNRWA